MSSRHLGGSGRRIVSVQGQPGLHSESKASLNYTVALCFKRTFFEAGGSLLRQRFTAGLKTVLRLPRPLRVLQVGYSTAPTKHNVLNSKRKHARLIISVPCIYLLWLLYRIFFGVKKVLLLTFFLNNLLSVVALTY